LMEQDQLLAMAQKGALAAKESRYRELLIEISLKCATLQRASIMLLPGALDDIKEDEILLSAKTLVDLLAEARPLRAELKKVGVYVW